MPKRGKQGKKLKKPKIAFQQLSTTTQLPDFSSLVRAIPYKQLSPIFSFKYYDHQHKWFSAKSIKLCGEFYTLFERLKGLSSLTWGEIEQSGKYNTHDITDWSKTTEPHGFYKLDEVPNKYPAYQFKTFGECRIIGFFEGFLFHIVWIDRDHKLYLRK